MIDIKARLFDHSDEKFRDFSARLIPSVPSERVIGVKTPALRALSRELIKSGDAEIFLRELPHAYFEEDQLHAFIISEIRDFDLALTELERFLPYIDNWATCDQLIPRAIAREPERALKNVDIWLESGETYTVRFAIGVLMRYFLDERFDISYVDRVAAVKSEEYYVNMMCAWYFATALAKQYDAILPYFYNKKLPVWVHNRSIQKARESYRVAAEHKRELEALKRPVNQK